MTVKKINLNWECIVWQHVLTRYLSPFRKYFSNKNMILKKKRIQGSSGLYSRSQISNRWGFEEGGRHSKISQSSDIAEECLESCVFLVISFICLPSNCKLNSGPCNLSQGLWFHQKFIRGYWYINLSSCSCHSTLYYVHMAIAMMLSRWERQRARG